jgi:callose synthase
MSGNKLIYSLISLKLMVLLFFVKEIYRIKLPGPAKLGEGKPENQNHAIIFTRGEALQTIDMNQVNIN